MTNEWRTQRLVIEPLREEHAEALFEALDGPEVGAYIGGRYAESAGDLRDRIARQLQGSGRDGEDWWNFAVFLPGTGLVGTLQATVYRGWAEVAYLFSPTVWGHGYATEGLLWLVDRCRRAGADEMWAAVHPDNERSLRLLARAGFALTEPGRRPLGSYDQGDVVLVLYAPQEC